MAHLHWDRKIALTKKQLRGPGNSGGAADIHCLKSIHEKEKY